MEGSRCLGRYSLGEGGGVTAVKGRSQVGIFASRGHFHGERGGSWGRWAGGLWPRRSGG